MRCSMEQDDGEARQAEEAITVGPLKKRSEEVQAVLNLLDETEQKLERASLPNSDLPSRYSEAFGLVKGEILTNLESWRRLIHNEKDRPEVCVYIMLSTVAGNQLQRCGHYIYRGALDPLGLGNDLLRIFDTSLDQLFRINALEADLMKGMKETIRARIAGAG